MKEISPNVLAVSPQPGYKLEIEFENGERRLFDVAPYLERGIFAELKDLSYFNQVLVAFGSIQWPNGQDFSRDTVYIESSVA